MCSLPTIASNKPRRQNRTYRRKVEVRDDPTEPTQYLNSVQNSDSENQTCILITTVRHGENEIQGLNTFVVCVCVKQQMPKFVFFLWSSLIRFCANDTHDNISMYKLKEYLFAFAHICAQQCHRNG